MSETARFFDAVQYAESDQAEVQVRYGRTGVIADVTNALAVSVGGGFATVATGEAFVKGFWYKNDAAKPLAVTNNASATARVDNVVLRLNRTANTLIAEIHNGVLGAGAPALLQIDGGDWELLLATISTASSVTTVTDARTYSTNIINPMTTVDDIIVASASGIPIRKAKGANSSVFGVDAAGVLGYRPMAAISRLNFAATADASFGTITTGSAYDLIATQNFTVGAASSLMKLLSAGAMSHQGSVTGWYVDIGFYIDSATRYYFSSMQVLVTSTTQTISLNGQIEITGLSPGVHTLRMQAVPIFSSGTMALYFRAATLPGVEFGRFNVTEYPQ